MAGPLHPLAACDGHGHVAAGAVTRRYRTAGVDIEFHGILRHILDSGIRLLAGGRIWHLWRTNFELGSRAQSAAAVLKAFCIGQDRLLIKL